MSSLLSNKVVPSVVDNKPMSGLSATYPLNDPHSKELLYDVQSLTTDDVDSLVASSHKAFKEWKNTSPYARRAIFEKAAQLLEERKDEFVALTQEETTGNALWGNIDHSLALENIKETAALATALRGEIAPSQNGQRAYIERIPYGVVFGIAPWNAPLTLSVRAYSNAIMAGNACILKTSEYSPKIHLFGAQLFMDAGLPAGVLNVAHIAPKDAPAVCEKIIADSRVRKVNFTGSTVVGGKIAEVCGRNIKPVVLELGGKAPVIIMPDADLNAAANAVAFGGLSNSGQICMSSDSLLVHESVADEFIGVLTQTLKDRKASAKPTEPNGFRGLFSQVSADRVKALIDDATSKGAKVLMGGTQSNGSETAANVIQPTLLEGTFDTSKGVMRIASEEIFGPVMTINRFKTVEEAIERANSSDYGLAASIYSKDEAQAIKIAREIEAGQIHINGATVADSQTIPHGGLKSSGFGRFNSIEGLREFTAVKTITVEVPHGQYPF